MLKRSRIDSKTKVAILLKEYEARSDEIARESQRYQMQTTFATSYFSLVAAATGLLSINGELRAKTVTMWTANVPPASVELLHCFLLALVALVGFFLFASTLDALCSLYFNGFRRAALEELINARAGERLLVWDSSLMRGYWHSPSARGVRGWIKPSFLVGLFSFAFFIGANILLWRLGTLLCPRYAVFFAWFDFCFTCLCIMQWFLLHGPGCRQMAAVVERESGVRLPGDQKKKM